MQSAIAIDIGPDADPDPETKDRRNGASGKQGVADGKGPVLHHPLR